MPWRGEAPPRARQISIVNFAVKVGAERIPGFRKPRALGPFGPGSHLGPGPSWARAPFGHGPIWAYMGTWFTIFDICFNKI